MIRHRFQKAIGICVFVDEAARLPHVFIKLKACHGLPCQHVLLLKLDLALGLERGAIGFHGGLTRGIFGGASTPYDGIEKGEIGLSVGESSRGAEEKGEGATTPEGV